jgi:Ala-tRNA(Pro) deacylase
MDTSPFYAFLSEHGIAYQRCDHPAVYTVAEAARRVPPLPGVKTKNLFLRDKPGWRHFLVVVPAAKPVDLMLLSDQIGAGRLSFGSPDRLVKVPEKP